jgi:hypothetical protein
VTDTAIPTAPPPAATDPLAQPGTVHSTREIESLIPHRWPFLLVDRIVEYDADAKRIVGLKGVTATEWFFQGHFPGLPVMPGVSAINWSCASKMRKFITPKILMMPLSTSSLKINYENIHRYRIEAEHITRLVVQL